VIVSFKVFMKTEFEMRNWIWCVMSLVLGSSISCWNLCDKKVSYGEF